MTGANSKRKLLYIITICIKALKPVNSKGLVLRSALNAMLGKKAKQTARHLKNDSGLICIVSIVATAASMQKSTRRTMLCVL